MVEWLIICHHYVPDNSSLLVAKKVLKLGTFKLYLGNSKLALLILCSYGVFQGRVPRTSVWIYNRP